MIVDKSLSRGLADRAFDMFGTQGLDWALGFRDAPPLRNGKAGVKRLVESFVALGQRLSLTQLVGIHAKGRFAVAVPVLPFIEENDEYGSKNRSVLFSTIAYQVAINKPTYISASYHVLAVREHAVERLFQRLNSMDPAVVGNEIHDALCIAFPLGAAARYLGLKQIILPTRTGAFRGTLRENDQVLVANTWIPCNDEKSIYDDIADAIADVYREVGGEKAVAAAIASLPYGSNLTAVEWPTEMVNCLARFPLLTKEYEKRADPSSELWKQARQQAQSDLNEE